MLSDPLRRRHGARAAQRFLATSTYAGLNRPSSGRHDACSSTAAARDPSTRVCARRARKTQKPIPRIETILNPPRVSNRRSFQWFKSSLPSSGSTQPRSSR